MIQIDLQPEVEARLAAEARAQGIGVQAYAEKLLKQAFWTPRMSLISASRQQQRSPPFLERWQQAPKRFLNCMRRLSVAKAFTGIMTNGQCAELPR